MTTLRAEVVAAEPSIDDLVETVHREHQLVGQALSSVLAHAIAAGTALLAIQGRLPHGTWTRWVETNLDIHYSTANDYMRVAHFKGQLEKQNVTQLEDALWLLRGKQRTGAPGRKGLAPELPVEARKLAREGMKAPEISERLGVSDTTVYWWLNPQKHRAHLDKLKNRNAEGKRLREQAQARTIQRVIKKQGGAISELYAMAERMQDVLGQAHGEEGDADARRHLGLAGQHYRRMRDEIVKALGSHDLKENG